MDSDYPRSTCENVVYHFHGTMQTIITFFQKPVSEYYDPQNRLLRYELTRTRIRASQKKIAI